MGRMMRSCVQALLKLVNSVMGLVGIALVLYALWLIRVWDREIGSSPFDADDYSAPWFIYTTLGLGVAFCLLTCTGHIAADTVNGCCLYLYMAFVFMLIILEAGVTADVLLNSGWEEDFPEDPSKSFDLFKKFIKSNLEMCKWVGLSIVSVQGLSLLLAMVLKALGPNQYYDSDDEFDPESQRVPLLNNAIQPPRYVVGDPVYAPLK